MARNRSIENLVSRRDQLMAKLSNLDEILRGTINSVCAKCQRANCVCESKPTAKSYRLTYKDKSQKTKIVYIPKARLSEAKRMIRDHAKAKKFLNDIVALNVEIFKIGRP